MNAGRPRNKNRDFAALNGDRFYEGSACWCGCTTRYQKGGRCVDCAISQARAQSAKKRKPKMATPAQARIVSRRDVALGTRIVAAVEAKQYLEHDITKQIADLAAHENEITAEEAARAEKVAAVNRIETGGLTLCGVRVSEMEMAEYVRSGVVPARILKPQETDE
jgi:hypothetical protein